MIWVAFAFLILAALIVVLPSLSIKATAKPRTDGDLAVYRDQLKEIDLDLERSLITALEADAARTEIKRRILALGTTADSQTTVAAVPARAITTVVAVIVAGVSLGTYLYAGRPGLPARPYDAVAEREAAAEGILRDVNKMVANLAEKLKSRPDDAKGWRMLGWSYLQLGRTDEGLEALKRAIALDPENGPLRSQYGEALIRKAAGTVTAEALATFDEALKRDAKDPRARYYKGLALAQSGNERGALDLWVAILRDGPPDAEWFEGIRAQARELATKLKLDPKTTVP